MILFEPKAEKYKRRVAEEFGIPLFVQKIVNSGDINLITHTSVSEDKLNGTAVKHIFLIKVQNTDKVSLLLKLLKLSPIPLQIDSDCE
ncbi:hypothetical protein SETIT_6G249800v2 [Setaria italica]|uniref:Uncharacterized protein n=1 Tax=Setaria italica TaxID=4555 RepID=A0A368RQJ9_SETIT|nr:hypothetical protein SETIT_6G249800v2 [Setaria italica]